MPDGGSTSSELDIAGIAADMRLRAAAFIVTLYGDAVAPRGGEVWIGTIIETCARVGISETLVRTAVSRLVAARQLEGRRRGRRSFYRLTDGARTDFDVAAALIYGPPDNCDWRFTWLGEGQDDTMARLEQLGHVRLRPGMTVGPARGPVPAGMVVFDAAPEGAEARLAEMAQDLWTLEPHAQAYRALIDRFHPALAQVDHLGEAQALSLRLLLVHAWRQALLRDPRLPAKALPDDWPGHAARNMFAALYAALCPKAESHIAQHFQGCDGVLTPTLPNLIRRRLETLKKPGISQ